MGGFTLDIDVTINGEKKSLADGTTIEDVLEAKDVRPEMVAVELNGDLVQKGDYPSRILIKGDQMEFLFYMAGGRL